MMATALLLVVTGACIGSFLNVVAWRLPRKESVIWPSSHCPNCGHAVRWHDNIPVLGWMALAGRCRDCRWPIPSRYPMVEFVTAGLWWSAAGAHGLSTAAPALLHLVAGVVLSLNIGDAVAAVEGWLGFRTLEGTYFVRVPSRVLAGDVAIIGSVSWGLCVLAAWLPARRAANADPVAALHGS